MAEWRKPAQHDLALRKRLQVEAETVGNQSSNDFPSHWPGENHEWNLDYFRDNFKIQFHESSPLESQFSLVGIDTSVANAFRRIMIAEIPTLAIEDVFIFQNTSIIQDEVLAHRLGLIPLCGDRNGLNWMKVYNRAAEAAGDQANGASDYNCAIFHLKVKCEWQEGGLQRAAQGETDPDKLFVNHNIYAKDIDWTPHGKQNDIFDKDQPIRASTPGILIAKMRPGQEIALTMHAFKGIGSDHAKFSPVATASYKLLPTIDIIKPIIGADAKKFIHCFVRGVVETEPITDADVEKYPELAGHEGEDKAVVKNTFDDTVSRECLRHPEFKDKVKLGRVRDHFIFKVESTGQWESEELFLESIKLLKVKCQRIRKGLDAMNR